MKKDSFILHNAFYEPIKKMTDEQLGKLFRSLFEYSISQNTEVDNEIQMAFLFFKNQIDIDCKKYVETCKKRSEAGKKGMENRWKNDKTNDNKNNKCYQSITNVTNITDNDNEYDNDNENDNVNDNDNENIYIYIETNFGRTLSPVEYGNICQWLLDYDEEIVRYAIDKSVLAGKKTIAYANGILKNWKGCNYTTLQEIKDNEEKPKNKVLEHSPKWDESNSDDLLSDEELAEFEKQLRGEK